jgi:hypothetical protein
VANGVVLANGVGGCGGSMAAACSPKGEEGEGGDADAASADLRDGVCAQLLGSMLRESERDRERER